MGYFSLTFASLLRSSLGGAQRTLRTSLSLNEGTVFRDYQVLDLKLHDCFCRTLANRLKYVWIRNLPPKTASLSFNLGIERSGLRGKGPK